MIILRFVREDYEVVPVIIEQDIGDIVYVERTSAERKELVFVSPTAFFSRNLLPYLPDNQIVLIEAEGELIEEHNDDGERNRLVRSNWNSAYAHRYDLFSKERVETIDLLDLVEIYRPGYWFLSNIVPAIFRDTDGDLYIAFGLAVEGFGTGSVRMNLQTKEAFGAERLRREWTEEEREHNRELGVFWGDWNHDNPNESHHFLRQNGFENTGNNNGAPGLRVDLEMYDGVVSINLPATNLPQESEELYSRFPGLREFIGREDLEVVVFIGDFPSPEEILTMFMEDGREIVW